MIKHEHIWKNAKHPTMSDMEYCECKGIKLGSKVFLPTNDGTQLQRVLTDEEKHDPEFQRGEARFCNCDGLPHVIVGEMTFYVHEGDLREYVESVA